MRKTFTLLLLMISTVTLFAQSEVRGVIVDQSSKESLIGASVVLKGTTKGTVSNVDGSFTLTAVPKGKNKLEVSYIGYVTQIVDINVGDNVLKLPTIELQPDAIGLNEIRVLANIAIDRQTPIAVSNIKPVQIEEKLGTQEYPEILKSSPGIYATKRGGGFGDADVRIRGFGSTNVAVMINGMPVNGMEDDKVYWSNWAGLSDVTRTMQVQRGIGASKIAVPSVGGTINIITKTTDAKKGGSVFYNVGSDNYQKEGITLSTGLLKSNWALTMMFSKTKGNGYVEGTPFTGYSYFMSAAKKLNDRHQFVITLFGAPQNHAKRYNYQSLDILKTRADATRYNEDWGYLNGQFYSNSTNFYHKPVFILNHYFTIDENTDLSTSLYASYGIGGGGYTVENDVKLTKNAFGQYDWDKAVEENNKYAANGKGGGMYFQNSYNNHSWLGGLSTLKKTVGPITYLAGVDLRYYYGQHWQQADDLFGAGFVYDKVSTDAVNFYNRVVREGGKINYDNDGEVAWEGLFLQAEYSKNKLTAFVSTSLSNRSYRRYDFAQYLSEDMKKELKADAALAEQWENTHQTYMKQYSSVFATDAFTIDQRTEWRHFLGYSLKAGANYNLTEHHNVFVNGGYMERQPIFSTVFRNNKNKINPSAVNEKVASGEIGYGYRSQYVNVNVNGYYTRWNDKTVTGSVIDKTSELPNQYLYYNIEGVNARHAGIELDFVYEPTKRLSVNGMVSVGDWIWANNVDTIRIYKDQTLVYTYNALYLKGTHVADAAQTSASIGANYELFPGLKLGLDLFYFDRLYAGFDVESRTAVDNEDVDVERVPAYALVDMNMYYSFKIGDLNASLYSNMNNVFNTIYIADAVEGKGYFFGFGRTVSMGLKVRF